MGFASLQTQFLLSSQTGQLPFGDTIIKSLAGLELQLSGVTACFLLDVVHQPVWSLMLAQN